MAQSIPLRRRQNKSCDNCRIGKRKCDLQVSIQYARQSDTGLPHEHDDDSANLFASSPCSNCKKWKKKCTIDWIRSRQAHLSTSSAHSRRPKRALPPEDVSVQDPYAHWSSSLPPDDVEPVIGDHVSRSSFSSQRDDSALGSTMGAVFGNYTGPFYEEPSFPINSHEYQTTYGTTTSDATGVYSASNDMVYPLVDHDVSIHGRPSPTINSDYMGSWGMPISNPQSVTSNQDYESSLEESRNPRSYRGNWQMNKTASPFTSHLLTEDHNRLYIKKGLMKIYHDSLEGALSCWLIERNCPYASSPFVDGEDAWSSNFSNRMVGRVRALDEKYSKSGLISKDEQKQASNVLGLVVMAFAVQWAQTAYGRHDNLSTHLPEHGVFGRNMQKTLWHKANLALSQATTNPSLKVIFAGIIFSLTQRPMESAEVLSSTDTRPQKNNLSSLQKILDDDNGPIFLDVAVRKLHDHQRRLKDLERSSQGPQNLVDQDKQTFGLLFWLAIMFDTLSAAMNRRSFALSDGDTNINDDESHLASTLSSSNNDFPCDLDGYSGSLHAKSPSPSPESQLWGNYFLRQQSRIGDVRKQTTRWPCSYTEAAACLADAAPVKVLVFRRVGHLQNLYYQHASAEAIEHAIAATLEVYNHWKGTYGLFISDCVKSHESLPVRIQSWYILLASHWHLAILLLADLIEKLDNLKMTLPGNRTTRQTADFAATLRIRSVYAVSDLGRCSRFGSEELSFSRSPDFHHAVNKAALLTEPWTVVLVRSFARAGEVLVKLVLSRRGAGFYMDTIDIDLADARSRLDDCIEALWLLGRKSDMALSAAKILQETLNQGLT